MIVFTFNSATKFFSLEVPGTVKYLSSNIITVTLYKYSIYQDNYFKTESLDMFKITINPDHILVSIISGRDMFTLEEIGNNKYVVVLKS
jgi:hypothetical protein